MIKITFQREKRIRFFLIVDRLKCSFYRPFFYGLALNTGKKHPDFGVKKRIVGQIKCSATVQKNSDLEAIICVCEGATTVLNCKNPPLNPTKFGGLLVLIWQYFELR